MALPLSHTDKRLSGGFRAFDMRGLIVALLVFACISLCALACSFAPTLPSVAFADEAQSGSVATDATKVVRVGYFQDSEEFQYGASDEDRKTGYCYEYYQEVAKYTGWTYEYVYGDYQALYQQLLAGEIDIMASVSKTTERQELLLFPNYAMGGETYYIFAPESDTSVSADDPSVLNGARVGVKPNTYMSTLLESFCAENGVECELVYYSTLEERMAALQAGEIDFAVSVETDRVSGFYPAFNLGEFDYYLAVAKDRPDILEELNTAQQKIFDASPYYTSELRAKYYNDVTAQRDFTDEEQEWLSQRSVFNVGYLNDYMPFSDTDSETGEVTGAIKGIFDELSNTLGVEVAYYGFDKYDDMMAALDDGALDIVFPTYDDLWYSEEQHHTQTASVADTHISVVFTGKYADVKYDRIAVCDGSPLQTYYLQTYYPEAEQLHYDTWADCLRAIQDGEAECMLIGSNLVDYYMNAHPEFDSLQTVETDSTVEFCFAVSRNDTMLYSVLDKAISGLDETLVNDILLRYSVVERPFTVAEFVADNFAAVLAVALLVVALISLGFGLYLRQLSRDRRRVYEAYTREQEYIQSLKSSQEATREAYEEAKRANSAKSDFLARMSHDIRTPLNAITGLTAIAQSDVADTGHVRQCLGKIAQSGQHLLDLVNEVLDLSKIEAGRMKFAEAPFSLRDLMDDVVLPVAPAMDVKHQKFSLDFNIEHERVVSDRQHMRQAFVNLLQNASAYTPEGGRIAVAVREVPSGKPHIGSYEFTFKDNGIGMSEEFLAHVFEPFAREFEGKDTSMAGSGLGLAIVQSTVGMLGGHVSVQSEKDKGSCFTVSLLLRWPEGEGGKAAASGDDAEAEGVAAAIDEAAAADGVAAVSSEDAGAEAACGSEGTDASSAAVPVDAPVTENPLGALEAADYAGAHVLLAEDNAINAEIAKAFLKTAGLEVDHVWNGREAVDKLLASEPGTYRIVFMDIMMPEMDGHEAARAIRASGREDLATLPIYAMTANAFTDDVRAASEAGMDGHLAKPLDIGRLSEVLRKHLD